MKNNEILTQLTRIADALEMANVLNGLDSVPVTTAPTEQVEPVQEKAEPVETTYTHDDLKAACMTASRADVGNKPKLKALLAEYGASKAVDVAQDKLAEVIGKINAGEY